MPNSKMSAVEEESNDLSHCCVCFEEFDNGERKPKFLTCYHTLCLMCAKVKQGNHKYQPFHVLTKYLLQFRPSLRVSISLAPCAKLFPTFKEGLNALLLTCMHSTSSSSRKMQLRVDDCKYKNCAYRVFSALH